MLQIPHFCFFFVVSLLLDYHWDSFAEFFDFDAVDLVFAAKQKIQPLAELCSDG